MRALIGCPILRRKAQQVVKEHRPLHKEDFWLAPNTCVSFIAAPMLPESWRARY